MSFPRYPEYKDSGVEWLGEVPGHWAVKALKNVISRIESGVSVNAIDTPAAEGEIGVLKTSCVYRGWFDPAENKAVVPEEFERVACPVTAGTLIVSRMNTPDLVGAAGMVGESHPGLFLPDRLWQVYFADAHAAFIHYWTHSPLYRAQVQQVCAGASSSMQNLAQDQFRAFTLALPPVREQQAIAAFLDRETTKIDALVAEQQNLIALLKEKRQALISHAVTKGLDPDVPMKDSGVAWLGEVPAHWEVRRLSSASTKITNGYVGPTRDILVTEGVRYLQSLHIKNNRIVFSHPYYVTEQWSAAHAKSVLEKGDVLIVQTGDIGQVAVVTDDFAGCNCHALIIVSPLRQAVTGSWLSWVLNSDYGYHALLSIQTGALHPHLNCGNVKELPVTIPPLNEQHAIVTALDRDLLQLQQLTVEAEAAIAILQERRTALISAAVTGKIDVRQLAVATAAPTPEPA